MVKTTNNNTIGLTPLNSTNNSSNTKKKTNANRSTDTTVSGNSLRLNSGNVFRIAQVYEGSPSSPLPPSQPQSQSQPQPQSQSQPQPQPHQSPSRSSFRPIPEANTSSSARSTPLPPTHNTGHTNATLTSSPSFTDKLLSPLKSLQISPSISRNSSFQYNAMNHDDSNEIKDDEPTQNYSRSSPVVLPMNPRDMISPKKRKEKLYLSPTSPSVLSPTNATTNASPNTTTNAAPFPFMPKELGEEDPINNNDEDQDGLFLKAQQQSQSQTLLTPNDSVTNLIPPPNPNNKTTTPVTATSNTSPSKSTSATPSINAITATQTTDSNSINMNYSVGESTMTPPVPNKPITSPKLRDSPLLMKSNLFRESESGSNPIPSIGITTTAAGALSSSSPATGVGNISGSGIIHRSDPETEEQQMFEQRLCEDNLGVHVRKISSSGKSQLRYVKCVSLPSNFNMMNSSSMDPLTFSPGGVSGVGEGGSVGFGSTDRHGNTIAASASVTSTRSKSSMSGRVKQLFPRKSRDSPATLNYLSNTIITTHSNSHHHSLSSNNNNHLHPPPPSGSYQEEPLDVSGTTNLLNESTLSIKRSHRALMWGNKKRVILPLDRFVCVRKGKTTDRTKLNPAPVSRVLSLITDCKEHPSLDIEAPTKLDRDKFARAFAKFLNVPLETDAAALGSDDLNNYPSGTPKVGSKSQKHHKSSHNTSSHASKSSSQKAPQQRKPRPSISSNNSHNNNTNNDQLSTSQMSGSQAVVVGLLPAISPSTGTPDDMKFSKQPPLEEKEERVPGSSARKKKLSSSKSKRNAAATTTPSDHAEHENGPKQSSTPQKDSRIDSNALNEFQTPNEKINHHKSSRKQQPIPPPSAIHSKSHSQIPPQSQTQTPTNTPTHNITPRHEENNKNVIHTDDASDVSSITAGFDPEVVEELHHALNELRIELEASRAEAARAVKVAEQAIQSAESCTSNDWNSTVTHKAAEAAAHAQKRSAEAIARQRLAEERLAAEMRTCAFWRSQAEVAEDEVGALQTRAAAAEVQRAAMEEKLESERRSSQRMLSTVKEKFSSTEKRLKEQLEQALEKNRSLDVEMGNLKREYTMKCLEVNTLETNLFALQNNHSENEKIRQEKRKKFGRGRFKIRTNHNETINERDDSPEGYSSSLLLKSDSMSRTAVVNTMDVVTEAKLTILRDNSIQLRHQFEVLRRAMAEEIRALPHQAREWTHQISHALGATQQEILCLRNQLSHETAFRRKLHHEVQDLRGCVRVYCRPRPLRQQVGQIVIANSNNNNNNNNNLPDPNRLTGIISVPSHEIINLHRLNTTTPSVIPTTPLRTTTQNNNNNNNNENNSSAPLSFECDRVFTPETTQKELYSEMEELTLGALDGYNVCVMAFGPTGSGKTHAILGHTHHYDFKKGDPCNPWIDRDTAGVYFQSMKQLLTVAECRNDRFQDLFSITILEVHGEKLCDLCAGTSIGQDRGEVQGGSVPPSNDSHNNTISGKSVNSRRSTSGYNHHDEKSNTSSFAADASKSAQGSRKLEIRTNYDGDTIVQGLISIPIKSMDDVWSVWDECLAQRSRRIAEAGISLAYHEAEAHIIATINVVSTNIATGVGTVGKIQFVDLAGADVIPKRGRSSSDKKEDSNPMAKKSDDLLAGVGNNLEWKFSSKSIATLSDVILARSQFTRSVPYRNSTLTHLLRDSLQGDSKILMLLCLSTEEQDLQASATALRFASRVRSIEIGKATKHTVSLA